MDTFSPCRSEPSCVGARPFEVAAVRRLSIVSNYIALVGHRGSNGREQAKGQPGALDTWYFRIESGRAERRRRGIIHQMISLFKNETRKIGAHSTAAAEPGVGVTGHYPTPLPGGGPQLVCQPSPPRRASGRRFGTGNNHDTRFVVAVRVDGGSGRGSAVVMVAGMTGSNTFAS